MFQIMKKCKKLIIIGLLTFFVLIGTVILFTLRWVQPSLTYRFEGDDLNLLIQPEGSRLFIDDAFVGQSPVSVRLDPGRYQLSVRGIENESILWETLVQACPSSTKQIAHSLSPGIGLVYQASRASGLNWHPDNELVYFNYFVGSIHQVGPANLTKAFPIGVYLSSLTLNPSGSLGLGFDEGVYGYLPMVYDFNSGEIIELDDLSLCATWLPSGDGVGILNYQEDLPPNTLVLYEVDLRLGSKSPSLIDSKGLCQLIGYSANGAWFIYHGGNHLQIHSVASGYTLENTFDGITQVAIHPEEDLVSWVTAEGELMIFSLTEPFEPTLVGRFHNVTQLSILDEWIYFVQTSEGSMDMSYWRVNYHNDALQLVLPSNLIIGHINEIKTSPDHSLVAYINHVDNLFLHDVGN